MRKVLKVDGTTITELDLDAPEGSYNVLSTAVKGLIENVTLRDETGLSFYCNEEYLYADESFEPNPVATILWARSYETENVIWGPVVFTGGIDDEGEELAVTEAQEELVRKIASLSQIVLDIAVGLA